jgi:FixJ family two-component response regulator
MLLTGFADIKAASRAVNQGQIFRFLVKPCKPDELSESLRAAVEMHRLLTAERVLLHKTLVGAVNAVIGVLGLTHPEAMGRAVRVRDRSRKAAEKLELESHWAIEFAAMISQFASVSASSKASSR